MNRNKLKTYAPQARRDFIQAVTDRASQYGLTASKIEPMTEQGEVVLIAGQPFPKSVGVKRKKLEARIQKLGFEQTMEAMAYTWFNRLVAIRFMELHGYLEHGFRVLSHPEGHTQPEILEHAQHVDLPGLDQQKVIDLKLDGTKEEELYRLLLLAQCNALHKALPFLFESIDDETELLLPDNLLHSDSSIRKLVNEIDEADWHAVEIIGWLYQFYISEKKDEVIGKVVASEDIPAATQLFTPNWIVKYLVQNTLGRQWLATYRQSSLRQHMEYYIEPAEQTPEVQEQLKTITPTSLNPEELTLLDPACGSGHILVEAYDLFKAIYQERGYRAKDIPAFILQKNLFGLEIDDRAAQLAAFALMMKARADDRRIFDSEAKPNILAFEDSQGMNAADIAHALNSPILKEPLPPKEMLFEQIEDEKAGLFSKKAMAEKGYVSQSDITSLLALFENANTFGSLILVPPKLAAKLPEIEQRLNDVLKHGNLTHAPANVIRPLLQQARLLTRQYDAVVANPPYMGTTYLTPALKSFVKTSFGGFDKDLFSAFIVRCVQLAMADANVGLMSPFVWMFISAYEELRTLIISDTDITTLVQLEYSGFAGATVPVCVFTLCTSHREHSKGAYIRLSDFRGADNQGPKTLEAIRNRNCGWFYIADQQDYQKIPGSPITYWMSDTARNAFETGTPLGEIAKPRLGMTSSDNNRFLRHWFEIDIEKLRLGCLTREQARTSGGKWFPYNKGGEFRKWFGNNLFVINWEDDGKEVFDYAASLYGSPTRTLRNVPFFFQKCVTWSFISSSYFGVRYSDEGFIFDVAGSSAFCDDDEQLTILNAFLCSKIASSLLKAINPTMNFQAGDVASLPWLEKKIEVVKTELDHIAKMCIKMARQDWDSHEMSWCFRSVPVLMNKGERIEHAQEAADGEHQSRFVLMKELEEENNRLFIEAYGLQDELSPDVPDDQITLYQPDSEVDIKRLLSYAIGCMMGRYSLDKPGLIYAHNGNQGFDPSQYTTFSADEDGILPLTEFNWFADDAANRFEKFVGTAWPADHLEDNLQFVAESIGQKKGESPREIIRRYLAVDFFKHHQSMYKKRPIYWLFSSGKQRGFQALVYLHRYNEGTLARMRTEYVIPLLGKMTARIDHLTDDIAAASSSQHKKRLEAEKATITKQLAEVQSFDEKLRHCADQRIKLDLDDGVKVNYAKFGDLLADVKAVCGTKDED